MTTPPHPSHAADPGSPSTAAEVFAEVPALGTTEASAPIGHALLKFASLALGSAQLAAGVLANSQSLIADGLLSLAGAAAAMVVITARKPESHLEIEHHHGELLQHPATILLAAAMFGAAAGVGWHALTVLQTGYGLAQVKPAALLVALAVLLVKQLWPGLFLRPLGALGIHAAPLGDWSSGIGLTSSIVVAGGVLGNFAGITILDPLAALLLAGFLVQMAGRLISHSPNGER